MEIATEELLIAVVVSRFNPAITDRLLAGCLETLSSYKIPRNNITTLQVPGAFELPLTCKKLCESRRYDAVIALGAVIRGETYHYELVCDSAASGIMRVSTDTGVPVIFGVLTCDSEEQADQRLGGKEGHKGSDAADAAIDMIKVVRQIDAAGKINRQGRNDS